MQSILDDQMATILNTNIETSNNKYILSKNRLARHNISLSILLNMKTSAVEGVHDTSEVPRKWSGFCGGQVEASAHVAAVFRHNIELEERSAADILAQVVLVDNLMELVGSLKELVEKLALAAPDIAAPLVVRLVEPESGHSSLLGTVP